MTSIREFLPVFFSQRAARCLAVAGLVVLTLAATAQQARAEVDTEHMFGFTEGSDIGAPRQLEAEVEEVGRWGREGGTYSAFSTNMNLKYPLTDSFRVAGGVTVTRFDSFNVAGVDNINAFALDRLTAEFRWRPLDRETAPLGLTFVAAPFYGFVDDVSGAQASAFGATLIAIADRELIHEKLYGAVNLVWQFQRAQPYATQTIEDASLLGFSTSFSTRIADWLYLGAEARYLRAFDGMALNALAGQAVYVGPNFYLPFAKGMSLSGGWNIQAWGQSTGAAASVDLTNFESQMLKVRFAIDL
ncbi:MAG: hypothetical protein Q8L22_19285 [Reyranella sp.]|nr:hypothetical protein [Reyranella sp.]